MALLKRSLQALHEQAKARPSGYVEDVLRHAQRVDDAHYWIDPQAYLELCRRWQTVPPSKPRPSRPRQIVNLIGSAARATGPTVHGKRRRETSAAFSLSTRVLARI